MALGILRLTIELPFLFVDGAGAGLAPRLSAQLCSLGLQILGQLVDLVVQSLQLEWFGMYFF